MKRLMLALLALTMFASIAVAQSTGTHIVTGTVVSATSDALVLDTPSGQVTFKLDSMLDRTRYASLSPGTRVEVTHKTDASGTQEVVTDVSILQNPTSNSASNTTYAANTSTTQADRLPSTASPLASLILLSMLALLGGLALRKVAATPRLGR